MTRAMEHCTEYTSADMSSKRLTSDSSFMEGILDGIEGFGVVALGRTLTMSAMSERAYFCGIGVVG